MFLSSDDLVELTAFRRQLHRFPEISGEEKETAQRVRTYIEHMKSDRIIEGLGGHGLAVIFEGQEPGPSLLIRSELDALPIFEKTDLAYRSQIDGKGHLCGHDGHSTILVSLGLVLSRQRPQKGRVILMFQPAEETGAGAAAVLADPRFAEIVPDISVSLHNLPGLPLGHVSVMEGVVNCASRGIKISLSGKTAHASMPEQGISPMSALSELMPALVKLGVGLPKTDEPFLPGEDFRMVTITHANMGEAAFGISPADAELWATLRTLSDDNMDALCAQAEALVTEISNKNSLKFSIAYDDIFLHCENSTEATAYIITALKAENIPYTKDFLPMRGSEDFGRFGSVSQSAMFFLGAGQNHANLHNPDYDFPDELIDIGARIFMRIIRNING
jgi:amidohydrolase